MSEGTHLYLVGDDEALDILAELTRYLPLFQLARIDEVPADLPPGAVVVIGVVHPRQRDVALADAWSRAPRHVAIVPTQGGADPGARAIVVAAELVALLLPELASKQPA